VLRRLPVLSDWGALFAAADASAAAALPAAERLDLVTALSAAVHATAEREAAARGDLSADAAGALPLKSTARKGRKGRGKGAGDVGGDDDAGSLRGATIVLMDALPRLFADYGAEPHAVRLQSLLKRLRSVSASAWTVSVHVRLMLSKCPSSHVYVHACGRTVQVAELVTLLSHAELGLYAAQRREAAFEALVDTVAGLFERQTDVAALSACAAALAAAADLPQPPLASAAANAADVLASQCGARLDEAAARLNDITDEDIRVRDAVWPPVRSEWLSISRCVSLGQARRWASYSCRWCAGGHGANDRRRCSLAGRRRRRCCLCTCGHDAARLAHRVPRALVAGARARRSCSHLARRHPRRGARCATAARAARAERAVVGVLPPPGRRAARRSARRVARSRRPRSAEPGRRRRRPRRRRRGHSGPRGPRRGAPRHDAAFRGGIGRGAELLSDPAPRCSRVPGADHPVQCAACWAWVQGARPRAAAGGVGRRARRAVARARAPAG
jgi:hypothetical protein